MNKKRVKVRRNLVIRMIQALQLEKIQKPEFRNSDDLSPLLISCFSPKQSKKNKRTALINSCLKKME